MRRSQIGSKPPTGKENILSKKNIIWCLRENIRIEAIKEKANSSVASNRLNSLVDDYNSRCGSFRYREGTLTAAQRDIEPFEDSIALEAIREAREWDVSSKTLSRKNAENIAPNKPNPKITREAQTLLTELGYAPGPIDGDFGRRTYSAVIAFQERHGLTEDGWISELLLERLKNEKLIKQQVTKANQTNAEHSNEEINLSGAMSNLSDSDRQGIINACRYRGSPADVYSCQKQELGKLQRSGPGPDLSGLSDSDRQGIINACRYRGSPADVYSCQRDEIHKLKSL